MNGQCVVIQVTYHPHCILSTWLFSHFTINEPWTGTFPTNESLDKTQSTKSTVKLQADGVRAEKKNTRLPDWMITIMWTIPDEKKSTFLFSLTTTASSSLVRVWCVCKGDEGKGSLSGEQKQEIYNVCSLVGLGGWLCVIPADEICICKEAIMHSLKVYTGTYCRYQSVLGNPNPNPFLNDLNMIILVMLFV